MSNVIRGSCYPRHLPVPAQPAALGGAVGAATGVLFTGQRGNDEIPELPNPRPFL